MSFEKPPILITFILNMCLCVCEGTLKDMLLKGLLPVVFQTLPTSKHPIVYVVQFHWFYFYKFFLFNIKLCH